MHIDLSRRKINCDASLAQLPQAGQVGRMGQAPQSGANARKQLRRAEGLGDVIVGAGIQSIDFVFFGVADGQHDDGDLGRRANQPARFDPAHAGHVHV